MSFDGWSVGLTEIEQAAGVGRLLSGSTKCHRGQWECDPGHTNDPNKRLREVKNSSRYKAAAKITAGLDDQRKIKLALIDRVCHNSLRMAIVQYMDKENLPKHYATILQQDSCINKLVEGILYKVCKIEPIDTLTENISKLSSSLRLNIERLTAYDRVAKIQRFIHYTVDQRCGVGAAQSIPTVPMRNALSAARLHFNIYDVTDREPSYTEYIDAVSRASLQLEYDDPRPWTSPSGKRSWQRWRVRHLHPLSYYFPSANRSLIQDLRNLDENKPLEEFLRDAILLYATRNAV